MTFDMGDLLQRAMGFWRSRRQPRHALALAGGGVIGGMYEVGALAALTDEAHQRETQEIVDAGRNYLQEQFREMKLKFVPGAANFVMVNVGDGAVVFKKLLAQKIIVRPLKGYNLPEWVRITVGTMEQNKKCIAALKKVLL